MASSSVAGLPIGRDPRRDAVVAHRQQPRADPHAAAISAVTVARGVAPARRRRCGTGESRGRGRRAGTRLIAVAVERVDRVEGLAGETPAGLGVGAPASVYVTLSRSGLTCRPWNTSSSPVFTTAVTCSGGTTSTSPGEEPSRPDTPRQRRQHAQEATDLHAGIRSTRTWPLLAAWAVWAAAGRPTGPGAGRLGS